MQAAIAIIGPPSQVDMNKVQQSETQWALEWKQPDRFWLEQDAQPVSYILELECGLGRAEIVYDDPASVRSTFFMTALLADWTDWEYDGTLRIVKLSAQGKDGASSSLMPLTCQQGDNMTIGVTARNRVFNSPITFIRTKVIAPPSAVIGLRSKEYSGGVTLSWEKVGTVFHLFALVSALFRMCFPIFLPDSSGWH